MKPSDIFEGEDSSLHQAYMDTLEESLEGQVDKHWEELFNWICDELGDSLHELVIEVSLLDGKTIRRSWRDREKWIESQV